MGPMSRRERRLPDRVHLLGVGGAGVSGVARILHGRGHRVSGHDARDSDLLDGVRSIGVDVSVGESRREQLPRDLRESPDGGCVVRSSAVPDDDPQVQAAREAGVAVLKYAEALGLLFPAERTLAVAGTHGKTTTSWMLWRSLAGLATEGTPGAASSPAALIGGLERELETNAVAGARGAWCCVEACEYDRSFLHLSPRGAIVTNVEADHLDYYGTFENVVASFCDFVRLVDPEGLVVLGPDVPAEVERASRAPVWRLGRDLDAALCGERSGCFEFFLDGPGFDTPAVRLSVPGRFNVDNAALAMGLAIGLGAPRRASKFDRADLAAVANGVGEFCGAGRRFEPWGTAGGVDVVHDYAHHPTEVGVTIEAARRAFAGRPIHVLFQPHQFSRTARFLEEFADSLRAADRVVVADVYGARKHIDGQRHAGSPELVTALRRRNVAAEEGRAPSRAVETFVRELTPGAVALVIGAGDIDDIRDELFESLALRSPTEREPRG